MTPLDETLEPLAAELAGWLVARGEVASRASVSAALGRRAAALDDERLAALVARLQVETAGLGPLQEFVEREGVTDVLVNADGQVWTDDGQGLRRVGLSVGDESRVRGLAVRLATRCGRRLDDAMPWVDGQLPGGVRLHAVLPPVSQPGTVISLRVPPRRALGLRDLEEMGAFTPAVRAVLEAIVEARLSVVVTGGTGSGKTTLLAALLGHVSAAERIVLVEDAPELTPDHRHVVRLQARAANVEGAGEVTLRDLVRQALRMRPDRLVVGEVRGEEILDLLAALNTGHDGGATTVHANAPGELPTRFEALALRTGLTRAATHAQLEAGVQVILHVQRRAGRRVLAEVAYPRRQGDLVTVETVLRQQETSSSPDLEVHLGAASTTLADLLRARGVRPPEWLGEPGRPDVTAATP
ncbi:MAG: TadA family conjugal transfer-associated ATPase [Actinomycetales bacterium]